jgi:hypothetical protein
MEEVFDSLVKVMHGSTTLVSIGDPMWDVVRINGGQAVQVTGGVRWSGIKAIPRGNQKNTLTFSLCNIAASVEAAAKAAGQWPISLPKVMADVTMTFADHSGVKLKNATVETWTADHSDLLGRHQLVITGGLMETIPAS